MSFPDWGADLNLTTAKGVVPWRGFCVSVRNRPKWLVFVLMRFISVDTEAVHEMSRIKWRLGFVMFCQAQGIRRFANAHACSQ